MTPTGRAVLDSWPVIEAARGSRHVISAIGSLLTEQTPVMSAVNYAEVYNAVLVVEGIIEARDTAGLLKQIIELDLPDYERIMQAAHLKSLYYLALGDCFAVATALHHEAEIWTGDAELLFDGSPWQVRDLRPGAGKNRPITRKERARKIGRRPRSARRPDNEPEIEIDNLMRFLDGFHVN